MNLSSIYHYSAQILTTGINFWIGFGVLFGTIIIFTLPMLEVKEIIINYLQASNNHNQLRNKIIIFCKLGLSILVSFRFTFDDANISILLTIAAIFTGLMFNLLLVAFDLLHKHKDVQDVKEVEQEKQRNIEKTIDETFKMIVFLVFVSLLIICFSLPFMFGLHNVILANILTAILIYLLITLIKTLFLVLKKVFKLIKP